MEIIILLPLILFAGFVLRLPFLTYPIDEDFGFYTYATYFRNQGVKILRDFMGALSPLFGIYDLAHKLFGRKEKHVRIFSSLYALLDIFSIFLVAYHLFGQWEGLAAALIFAVFSSSPYLGVYSCHAEGFYNLPLTLSVLALFHGVSDGISGYFFWAGALIGATFILKIVNALYGASFFAFLFFRGSFEDALNFLVGFTVAVGLYLLIMKLIYKENWGILWDHTRQRLGTVFGYIDTSFGKNYKEDFWPIWKETNAVFLMSALYLVLLPLSAKTLSDEILSIWAATSLAVMACQKVYRMYHYIPIVHVASLMAAAGIFRLIEKSGDFPPWLFYSLILFFFLSFLANLYRKWQFLSLYGKGKNLPYYQKADQFFYIPEIAKYIREKTSPEDFIYVWGPFVQLYRLSDRRAADSFIFNFVKPYREAHAFLFDDIVGGVISKRPRYIVLIRPDFDMEVLLKITGLRYELERIFFNRYRVYSLKDVEHKPLDVDKLSAREKIGWLESLTPGPMEYKNDDLHIRQGFYQEALREYHVALCLCPNDLMVKEGLASLLRMLGRYEEALDLYRQIEGVQPKREWLHLERGLTYGKMKTFKEAARELEWEERFFPGKAETLCAWGHVLKERKEYEAALTKFHGALEINPNLEWAHLEAGGLYNEMKQYEDALNEIRREEEFYPGKPETMMALGFVLRRQGKYEAALAKFHGALEINPNLEWAHLEAGGLYNEMRRYEEALNEIRWEEELYPGKPETMVALGSVLRGQGKYEEALRNLDEALGRNPSLEWAHFEKGVIYKLKGENEKAVEVFQRTVAINPSLTLAAYNLYSSLEDMGRTAEAKAGFLKIISGTPPSSFAAGSYFHLGKICFLEKDKGSARKYFESCLKHIPGHAEAARYLEMIK